MGTGSDRSSLGGNYRVFVISLLAVTKWYVGKVGGKSSFPQGVKPWLPVKPPTLAVACSSDYQKSLTLSGLACP